MNPASSSPKSRERFKVALIPVLSVVLWLVLRDNGEKPPVAELVTPARKVDALPRRIAAGLSRGGRNRASAITLEQALRHNPFTVPAAVSASSQSPAATNSSTEAGDAGPNSSTSTGLSTHAANTLLPQVTGQEASIVSRGPNGWAAVVAGKPVSVGDQLDSGLQVIAIGPEGVTVSAPATPQQ